MAVKKDFLRKLFLNNRFVLAFSIVVAFLFWLVITITENPIRDTTFSNITISVTAEGTAAGELGLDLISMSSSTATVKVSGPSYILAGLTASDISVSAPLDDVTEAGSYDITLSAASAKGGVSVVGVTPSKVSAVFDYTDTKQFTVEVEAVGAVAVSGLVADTPTVSNNSDSVLAITGPRSELQKIARVLVTAEVNETLSSTQSFDAGIKLFDADGNELDKSVYTIPVDSVKITVPILKQKTVPLEVAFSNTPAAYSAEKISYTASVSSVNILGPASSVDGIESIALTPIDFDSISADNNSFDVSPVLPNGVKLSENIDVVTVKINTSACSEKVLTVSEFRFKGVGDGLSATAGALKNVKICGPRAAVRSITASDLYAVADISGKTAGEYTVAVRVYSKTYDTVWQVGTYNVVVTIK